MNARPAMIGNCLVETFVAELTAAVYSVALRHGPGDRWLELELDLWNAVTDTVGKWEPKFSEPTVVPNVQPGLR